MMHDEGNVWRTYSKFVLITWRYSVGEALPKENVIPANMSDSKSRVSRADDGAVEILLLLFANKQPEASVLPFVCVL